MTIMGNVDEMMLAPKIVQPVLSAFINGSPIMNSDLMFENDMYSMTCTIAHQRKLVSGQHTPTTSNRQSNHRWYLNFITWAHTRRMPFSLKVTCLKRCCDGTEFVLRSRIPICSAKYGVQLRSIRNLNKLPWLGRSSSSPKKRISLAPTWDLCGFAKEEL